jgi:hypothetical protein
MKSNFILLQVLQWLAFLGTVHPPWSNGTKIDETKLTEPNAPKNVGPEPKLRGAGTKVIDLFHLIKRYIVDDRRQFVWSLSN